MKEALQNWLNPEAEGEVEENNDEEEETETTAKSDLPWEETSPKKESNYALKTTSKVSRADKFDALFEDED